MSGPFLQTHAPPLRESADNPVAWPVRRSHAWAAAIVAALAMTVSYVDRQTLAALKEIVKVDVHFNDKEYGYLLSAFSLAYLVAAPVAGVLVDRVGPRRGLAFAVGFWSLVAAAHMKVPGFASLFVLRLLLGTAEAPSFPGAASAIRRVLPPKDRALAFGLLFTGSSIGSAVSVPLAVWLNGKYGWRYAFLGTSLIAAAWLPVWLFVSRGSVGALLQPEAQAAPAGAPVYRGADDPNPKADGPPDGFRGLLALLKEPPVQRTLVLVFASAAAVNFVVNWLPGYFQTELRVPPESIGRFTWLPALMFDGGAVLFGKIVHPTKDRSKGLVLLSSAMAATLACLSLASTAWGTVAIVCVCMLGGGGMYSLLTSDMVARIDPRLVARAGGITAAGQSLAYILVNPIVGAIKDSTGHFTQATIGLGLFVIPGGILWCVWPKVPGRRVD